MQLNKNENKKEKKATRKVLATETTLTANTKRINSLGSLYIHTNSFSAAFSITFPKSPHCARKRKRIQFLYHSQCECVCYINFCVLFILFFSTFFFCFCFLRLIFFIFAYVSMCMHILLRILTLFRC